MIRNMAVATMVLALGTPAGAAELLNGGGQPSVVVGQYAQGAAAANGWNTWNNSAGVTASSFLAEFEGRSNVLRITSTGASNGLYRYLPTTAQTAYADIWVAVGQALFMAADNGAGVTQVRTSGTGAWQRVALDTNDRLFNEVTLYSSSDLADFYVSGVTVNAAAPVPEPATWGMLLLGFGGMGYAMRRRAKGSTRIRFA